MDDLQSATGSRDLTLLRRIWHEQVGDLQAAIEYYMRLSGMTGWRHAVVNLLNFVPEFARHFVADLLVAYPAPYQHRQLKLGPDQSYNAALNRCKSDYKVLAVYLHAHHNDDCHRAMELLQTPEMQQYFAECSEQVQLYATHVDTSEGWQLAQVLKVQRFAQLVLIAVTRGGRMQVAGGVSLSSSAVDGLRQSLARQLEVIERQSLGQLRREHRERQLNRRLQQEQQSAYERSLEIDRERARAKREQELLSQETQERKRLVSESVYVEPTADAADVIKVVMRMPNGSRTARRFARKWQLQQIYNYALSLDIPNVDDVQLVQSYPRRVLTDLQLSIGECIKDNEVLIVEEKPAL